MSKYIIFAILFMCLAGVAPADLSARTVTTRADAATVQTNEGGQPFDDWYAPDQAYSPEDADRDGGGATEPETVEQDVNRGDPNTDKFKDERRKSG